MDFAVYHLKFITCKINSLVTSSLLEPAGYCFCIALNVKHYSVDKEHMLSFAEHMLSFALFKLLWSPTSSTVC